MTKGLWLFVCLSVATLPAFAQDATDDKVLKKPELKTSTIVEETLSCIDCFDYEIIGMCFWLRCSFVECSIETSIKVKHYIPDLVVSAYTSDSAWKDTRSWNAEETGGITRTESPTRADTNLDWKSVDIITHPAIMVYDELGEEELFCTSMIDTPFMPLFLSSVDPYWNESWLERYLQIIGLETDIIKAGGSSGFTGLDFFLAPYWAPVYPRCGWGAHPYDPINAAVAAHRASEITTRDDEPHIYISAEGDCDSSERCWKPGGVSANKNTNKFQMMHPEIEDDAKAFGGSARYANGKHEPHEAYTWVLWRKYECCEREGQAFLGDIEW